MTIFLSFLPKIPGMGFKGKTRQHLVRKAGSHTPQRYCLQLLFCFSLPDCPASSLPLLPRPHSFLSVSHSLSATRRPRPLQGCMPCSKMASGASAPGEVSSRYSGREGRERAGGRVTLREAVGGAAAVAVVSRWGLARRRGTRPPLGIQSGAQGRGRWRKPAQAARLWSKKGGPGNLRPAPGGLFPRPSFGTAGGRPQLCLPGLRRELPSGLDRTLPLRTQWRKESTAGHSVSPEVQASVPVRGPVSFA